MSKAIEAAKVLVEKTENAEKKAEEVVKVLEELVTATDDMARRADEGDELATIGTPEVIAVTVVEAMEKAVKETTEAAKEVKTIILAIATTPNEKTIATIGMKSLMEAANSTEIATSRAVAAVKEAERAITLAKREPTGERWNEAVEKTDKAFNAVMSADKSISANALAGKATESMAVSLEALRGNYK